MTTEFIRIEPAESTASKYFWDKTRNAEFVLPWCRSSERPFFYPRETSPFCLGDDIEWRSASGTGVVYAVTVEHRPQNPRMAAMAPYAVALIDLDEGVRMLSNVVGCPAEDVHVGMRVRLTWELMSDGRRLPLFEPIGKLTNE